MNKFEKCFEQGLKKLDLQLSKEQINKFYIYKEMLVSWNEKINLTSITDEEEIVTKHFIDSLTISKLSKGKVIDIGTGAGFPGVCLKIADENIELTLLDSLNKRINFLKEVANELDLQNINFIHGRSEDLEESIRETYDIATSRAVAPLHILSELCLPYVKVGGHFLALKGKSYEEELTSSYDIIKELGGKITEIKEIILPNTDIVRNIVVIEKVSETPKKYPRRTKKIYKG